LAALESDFAIALTVVTAAETDLVVVVVPAACVAGLAADETA
jgi:hypothetical protein